MSEDLARVAAFLRAFDDACATRVEPWRFGRAFFRDDMPRVHDLNFVRLDAPGEPSARELVEAADVVQGRAGLRHRKIMVYDERGERLRREFPDLGWDTERDVVMVLRSAPPAPDRRRGEETTRADVDRMRELALRSYWPDADDDLVRQLAAKDRVFERGRNARYFVARSDDGDVVAACDLYSDGRTGQIEDVGTLEGHQRRGHATAVVLAAIDASLAAGHDLTFLIADDDDWPKQMYGWLGFETVGFIYELWRTDV